jgi:hypothetical protein
VATKPCCGQQATKTIQVYSKNVRTGELEGTCKWVANEAMCLADERHGSASSSDPDIGLVSMTGVKERSVE